MATEEPAFLIEKTTPTYDIRKYDGTLVAETEVDSNFEQATNEGFRILASYIFGNNQSKTKVKMTTPANQIQSEKIAMTTPVNLQKGKNGFLVQFTMPSSFTLETLPKPNDSRVHLRQLPAKRVAVRKYTGRWTEKKYQKELEVLGSALRKDGIQTTGEPIFARFNPPWLPWFLRRNEIWWEVSSP